MPQQILPPFTPLFSPFAKVAIATGQTPSFSAIVPPGCLPHLLNSQQFNMPFIYITSLLNSFNWFNLFSACLFHRPSALPSNSIIKPGTPQVLPSAARLSSCLGPVAFRLPMTWDLALSGIKLFFLS